MRSVIQSHSSDHFMCCESAVAVFLATSNACTSKEVKRERGLVTGRAKAMDAAGEQEEEEEEEKPCLTHSKMAE